MFRKVPFPPYLSACVLSYPQVFIVVPLLIAFLISYSPLLSNSSAYEASNTYLSRTLYTYGNDSGSTDYDYSLTKVILQPDDGSNALSKSFLIESFAAQAKITHNISDAAILHSPFELWNNDIQALRNDRSPLATIDNNLHKIPMFLFQALVKVNGRVSSASRLSFTVMSRRDNTDVVLSRLHSNIEQMNKIRYQTNFYIFTNPPASVPLGASPVVPSTKDSETFEFHISKLNGFDYMLFLIVYSLILSFFIYNIEHMKCVKSIAGISIAIISQLILTLYTGKAVTCFFFKSSPDNIPWFLMYVPIMFASLSNLFKLTIEKKGTIFIERETFFAQSNNGPNGASPYLSSREDFLNSMVKSNEYTLRTTLSMLVLLIIITPFSRKVSCFFISALIINLILQITYFSAVLSLDHRRFTCNELLSMSIEDSGSDLYVSLDKGMEETHSRWTAWVEVFTELKEWLPKTALLSTCPILTAFYMFYLDVRFASIRSSSSIFYKLFKGEMFKFSTFTSPFKKVVFDKRFVSNELYRLSGSKISTTVVSVNDPVLIIKHNNASLALDTKTYQQIADVFNSSNVNTYKFDVYYFFEFSIFLLLILVSTLLVLQLIIRKVDHYNIKLYETTVEERKKKNSSTKGNLVTGPSLSSSTEDSSSKQDLDKTDFHIKELSINGHQLDIVDIATSKAPFIVSIGIDHKVLVWSPLSNPMPDPTQIPLPLKFWPVLHTTLSNDGTYISFFNSKGRITCWSRKTKSFIWNIKLESFDCMRPLEAFFRVKTTQGFAKRKDHANVASSNNKIGIERRGSVISMKSLTTVSSTQFVSGGPGDASYENFSQPSSDNESMDSFIFITASNTINTVDNEGNVSSHQATTSENRLKSCKRLLTPRMNERLVMCDESGELFVSTVVNNKWKTRKLGIVRDRFNKGKGLMTPRSLTMKMGIPATTSDETLNDTRSSIVTIEASETDNTLLLVPFVGMAVKKGGHFVELVDVQSGTSIKKIKVGEFLPGSLRVFHDQPTHCRFCGSASVATLSIAYTSMKNSLIMHSFRLESKTKTSICLRVERDPREIRCLGLESVAEKKYHLSNVDRWDVTENNTLIGIRRKPELITASVEDEASSSSALRSTSATESDVDNKIHNRSNKAIAIKRLNSFKIHNVWEVWTMNADGKVVFHEIPIGLNGLLVNRIGPLQKFGTKSIVVGFGNIMKMFYLGHEEFLLASNTAGVNEENSGLRYVNKRRERLVHKVSPNYEVMAEE
ncbi:unnamed protein product [Kluyveromyces dobzhanskii CBS 2104]|uniref:WGS project CCBQ000000000 data, contig 00014 n=1 Tax=Kluyveromyces dobzhanskii CBS 2104 TaxID=1427455 RepID=A0A0A8L9E3_9SACH|nr:unnamed protein product [Kluyveromyces dobzhanskii CBS 2104]